MGLAESYNKLLSVINNYQLVSLLLHWRLLVQINKTWILIYWLSLIHVSKSMYSTKQFIDIFEHHDCIKLSFLYPYNILLPLTTEDLSKLEELASFTAGVNNPYLQSHWHHWETLTMGDFPYLEWLARDYKQRGENSGLWTDYLKVVKDYCQSMVDFENLIQHFLDVSRQNNQMFANLCQYLLFF